MSNTNKTEIIAPPVTTNATVQIQLGVADGVRVRFVRAKLSANRTLATTIKQATQARAAAAATREPFAAGIADSSDPIAGEQLATIDQLAGNILAGLSIDPTSPEYKPEIKYISNNPENRTRIFGYSRNVKYGLNDPNPAVPVLRGDLRLEWKVRVPMTPDQNSLLDTQAQQEALATTLEEKAKTIRHFIAVTLPELQEYAVADAGARWFARAEGAQAIYSDDFNNKLDELFADSAAQLGLTSDDLPALPGYAI